MADKISRRKKARVEAYENALKDLKNSKELLNAALKNLEASKSKFENELKAKHELCLKEEKTPKITSTDVENNQKAEVARRLKLAQEAKKQADGELNDLTTQLSSLQEKNRAKIASLEKELEKRTADHDKAKGKEKVSYDDIKNKYAKEVEQKVADNKGKIETAVKDLADFKVKVKKDKTLRTEYRYKKRALDLLKEKSSTNNIIKALYNEKNADVIKEEKEYNAFVRAYHFALDNECYDIKSLVNYELKLDEYKQIKEETKIPYFLLKFEAKEERKKRILQLMSDVGLSPEQSTRYAHSFSGGQRQRIGIARALASNPEFIVCDEPVSALDVSIQAQILNTFQELQKKLGLTYLFVAHNLLVVKHISDRIAVMYLGHIVELCESEELYKHPLHPYTISLLSAIPEPDPNRARANKRQILEGEIPSPLHVPSGCPFRLRCPRATDQCTETRPELIEVKKGHFTACHLVKPATKK
ncbi:MAG: ATP-binding cassette domain-containing protein [Bacilli bacterium]|nr:ATP-binding cassette domain-containing protein [Bacilli bacterium]